MTPPFRLNTARRPNAGVAEELCPCGTGCIQSYKNVKLLKLGLGWVRCIDVEKMRMEQRYGF